jgi:hypothetical protein
VCISSILISRYGSLPDTLDKGRHLRDRRSDGVVVLLSEDY